MGEPVFDRDRNSFIWLPAFDGANYRLYKSTWEFKLLHQERAHLGQNFELIKDTLLNPKIVRQSERDPDCFLAYKEFDQYILGQGRHGSVVFDTYIAVVVDKARGRIVTFYPCRKPKPGKPLWPPRAQK
jgi:hypothetical protein